MAFLSVLAAVVLEHLRPLREPLPHYRQYGRYTRWLEFRFNAGRYSHGAIAWALATGPLLAGVWLAFRLFDGISPVLGWAWNIAVLYSTLGFKYYSDDAGRIARRLRDGDLEGARAALTAWHVGDARQFDAGQINGVAMERILAASHRQMFGVLFWFVLLAPLGPVGAVLFRAASILERRWGGAGGLFGAFARRAFHAINWLPVRLTALTYAVAGNFEDATYCWRTQAESWPEREEGVVIAAGAGAMGVQLGGAVPAGDTSEWRPGLGTGQAPDVDSIDSAVSMIWRGLVIWLVAGLLVVVAGWVA